MRLKNKQKSNIVGPISCAGLLAIVAFGMICPQAQGAHAAPTNTCPVVNAEGQVIDHVTCPKHVQAGTFGFTVDNTKYGFAGGDNDEGNRDFGFKVQEGIDDEYHFTSDNDFKASFIWNEFIQITTDNEPMSVEMTVEDPTVAGGAFTSESAGFKVATNNAQGFGVYVYAADEASRNLSSADANNIAKIEPISANATDKNGFAANTWGYDITAKASTSVEYKPIKVLSNTAAAFTQQSASSGTELKLTCGTKVDASLPADTYTTQVVLSAVAPFSASLIGE